MVKTAEKDDSSEGVYDSRRQASLRHFIIAAPLVVAAVFSLGFAQFFSNPAKPVLTNNDENSSQSAPVEQLPLVTQPTLPTLNQEIEVITPPLPDSNPESRYTNPGNNSQKGIGPSSKDAMKALQGVHNSQGGNANSSLQGPSGQIKLEDAKL